MVSLLPSMAVTLPLPNFRWKTRSPSAKSETVPVDLATSSPSMVSGRRRARAAATDPRATASPGRASAADLPLAGGGERAPACGRASPRRSRAGRRRSRRRVVAIVVVRSSPRAVAAVEAAAVAAAAPRASLCLRALPAGRAVARAEMRHVVEARGADIAVAAHPAPKPPLLSVTSTSASGSSSRKREGMFDCHSPCMRRLVAK